MNWETMICFGDSITAGARSYLGYPEYCAASLMEKLQKSWNIINHSQNGFTTIDLVRSVDNNSANLSLHRAQLSTILIGTNDIKNEISTDDFSIAFEQLIIKIKLLTEKENLAVIEIPEFTEGIMYPYTIGMNKKIQSFNSIIRSKSDFHKVKTFRFKLDAALLFDGVHLNETGSKACGAQLAEFILKDKIF